MREAKWTKEICDEMAACGAVFIPIVGHELAGGWPDRVIWSRQWRGLIEFKGETTVVSKRQRANLRNIDRRRPGTAVVARYPGIVECPLGRVCFRFTRGKELLELLAEREADLNYVNPETRDVTAV